MRRVWDEAMKTMQCHPWATLYLGCCTVITATIGVTGR